MLTKMYKYCKKCLVALYFKASLLQCNYTFYVLSIINVLTIGLGFGLGVVACNYA